MPTRFELANAIRALAMDAVQKANSGHPGMPMGMADIAEVLWNDFLSHNPANPAWVNRDRFVVSNGHGSMLLYSLLNLSGYDLPMQELQNFRQMHSKTPGHPEYGMTPGVETTTGPLGQGLGNAVGMAIAEAALASRFNRDGHRIVDHYTYVFVGDGCLMEGISHEACSLAGTLGLNKLVVLYDDNNISIDGEVDGWFGDDTPARFEAYGWQVVRNVDGHNAAEIKTAIETAKASTDKPTLICCKTVIGFGSPNLQGKEKCHGAPLGDAEIALAREKLGWPYGPFEIPAEIRAGWDARNAGQAREQAWTQAFDAYAAAYPQDAAEFKRRLRSELPGDWSAAVEALLAETAKADKPVATRKSSKAAIEAIAAQLPELFGGSADLGESNCTDFKGHKSLRHGALDGNYVNYGVREFGMSAIMNGVALHGGLIPFGGTFLVFSDYARNALRMAALMKLRSIFVLTHDSIGLGEDGPTHQAVEHVSSLRLIPNMRLWRPADAFETAVAWTSAIERRDGPSALALSRQNLQPQEHPQSHLQDARRGGYVLWQSGDVPELAIIATGSEVQLAMEVAKALAAEGRAVRVVSMPCAEQFMAQDAAYRDAVLPPALRKRLAIEAGVSLYWRAFVGLDGDVVGVDSFGESAPASAVFKHFGFTCDQILVRAKRLLG
ncbi:transketolase [Sinimarinibacterium sp. CAU 1509]|uniref:transketolase n=1 Tax=Sinimarinibacterium sp. CAU 1509 TaxID=2562283 RepID=UPI0010AD214A|nr:transketolase [Sinimarinibacterium sp. CAU 1509]TJY58986.1 transketolase [Sinimarinibacterium sp. CAU 1509]